ncbi:hypothetical protein AB0J90_25515 [Micromonospora sp. NPDC049523]|uniref:hypothetical protein n=1 Tax=Micromonospora sp. NPDC049523 TaxID=3155921 RepID=UPI003420A0A6
MPTEKSESTKASTPKPPTTVMPKTTSEVGEATEPRGSTTSGGGGSVPYKSFVIGMSGRTRRRPRA